MICAAISRVSFNGAQSGADNHLNRESAFAAWFCPLHSGFSASRSTRGASIETGLGLLPLSDDMLEDVEDLLADEEKGRPDDLVARIGGTA